MLNLLHQLRRDEHGVILTSELVVVGSILVIGLITGTTCLQRSVDAELRDLGNAIGSLDQSFSFSGHRKVGFRGHCCAWTAGSSWLNCEEKDNCHNDIHGCATISATGCSTCGKTQCQGCVSTAITSTGCSTCGSSSCGGTCGSQSVSVYSGGVPGMKITESGSIGTPMLPISDPFMTPDAEDCCEQSEDACPKFAVPIRPPCTDEGDLIIPDSVW